MKRLGTSWGFGKPKPVTLDGIRFPSKSESKRYAILRLEEKGGLIRALQIHTRLPLVVNGKKIGRGSVEIDFVYERNEGGTWVKIWEDWKPIMSREAKQRIALAEALHGIKITLTGARA